MHLGAFHPSLHNVCPDVLCRLLAGGGAEGSLDVRHIETPASYFKRTPKNNARRKMVGALAHETCEYQYTCRRRAGDV